MSLRNERVRKELMRDISEIIRKEIRGIEGVLSIVDVEVSHDNSYAKVYYSVLGSEEQVAKGKELDSELRRKSSLYTLTDLNRAQECLI